MQASSTPNVNQLLRDLPAAEYRRLFPQLEAIDLPAAATLFEPAAPIEFMRGRVVYNRRSRSGHGWHTYLVGPRRHHPIMGDRSAALHRQTLHVRTIVKMQPGQNRNSPGGALRSS